MTLGREKMHNEQFHILHSSSIIITAIIDLSNSLVKYILIFGCSGTVNTARLMRRNVVGICSI